MAFLISFFTFFAYSFEKNEQSFLQTVDKITQAYKHEFNKPLKVVTNWSDDSFVISPREYSDHYLLTVAGGLFREKSVTLDGFALMVCHEIGHFLGGEPTYGKDAVTPPEVNLSVEGQSDYWAAGKCFKDVFGKEDNESWLEQFLKKNGKRFVLKEIIPASEGLCQKSWTDANNVALCRRTIFAGQSYARTARIKGNEKYWVNITTPSEIIVEELFKFHPPAQCRFDTFVAGALCSENLKDCGKEKDLPFSRPNCWFK